MDSPCPAERHCACCHQNFHTLDPSGEKARAEYERMRPTYDALAGPGDDTSKVVVVCDECYQLLMAELHLPCP